MSGTDERLRRLAAGTLLPGFSGTSLPPWVVEAYAGGLRSVALYGTNVETPQQLTALCGDVRRRMPEAVVAVDEEGGDVTRLHYPGGSPEPGNALLGRVDDLAHTAASARRIGLELAALGIGLDLAPVADVNSTDENPVIGVRSFGAAADLVARHTAASVGGLRSVGIAACLKHFPGHGDTVADSHVSLPRIDASLAVLRSRELVPFAAGIAAGAETVMTSHLLVETVDPQRPATFSPLVLRLLREGLGFDGVVVTDALDMAGASGRTGIPEAAVRALAAGCDLLCLGPQTTPERYAAVLDAVVAAIETGRLPACRVEEAAGRVARLAETHCTAAFADAPPANVRSDLAARALTDRELARAFSVSPRVAPWRATARPASIVQVDSATNLAVGSVAWGPAAVGATTPVDAVPDGAKVAVVGRGVGPDHPARGLARRLETAGHPVLLVECGWPRGDVDVVTYGASPAVASALVGLLTEWPS